MKRLDPNAILRSEGSDALRALNDAAEHYEPGQDDPRLGAARERAHQNRQPSMRYVPLVPLDGIQFAGEATPRNWHVESWIPAFDVSLLGGDGGTGKTQLGIQLAYASAADWTWLDMKVRQCKVIYYTAEESKDELHFRLEQITRQIQGNSLKKGDVTFFSVADADAELATFDAAGNMRPTQRFHDLVRQIKRLEAGLLILDAAADVFGGKEVDRRQVRAFVRLLRAVAIEHKCTIVLLAHPSVDGMKTGRGYSGSTHWNNAVRSRMYFTTPTKGDGGEELDPDLRILSLVKANRARKGQKISLRWKDGVFAVEAASTATIIERLEVNAVFLELLQKYNARPERVTISPCKTYAPTVFERDDDARGIKSKRFESAMRSLLDKRLIEVVEYGPPSHRRSYLRAVDGSENAT